LCRANLPLDLQRSNCDRAAPQPEVNWAAPLEVPVHVRPVWYEHRAALAAEGIAFILLVLALIELSVLWLRRRYVALEKVVAERTGGCSTSTFARRRPDAIADTAISC
jgi:hypothetical protein